MLWTPEDILLIYLKEKKIKSINKSHLLFVAIHLKRSLHGIQKALEALLRKQLIIQDEVAGLILTAAGRKQAESKS